MGDRRAVFLKMFKAEVEDLLADIGIVEGGLRERFCKEEITTYVYRENDAVFRIESSTLEALMKLIDEIKIRDYINLRSLRDDLEIKIRRFVEEEGAPSLIHEVLSRKLRKIYSYAVEE